MRLKQKLNPLRISKGLLSLLAMFVMLLAPERAWAEDYDLWIGETQVTSDNWDNIQGGNIKVGYARFIKGNDGSNTLQLHNIQTKDCIKSGLGNLTIELYGHNRIGYIANDEDNPAIYSTNGGTLTLTKGSTHASLYVETMMVESVIYGFLEFDYTGFSIEAGGGLYSQELGLNDGNNGVLSATFYTGDLYHLWVGETQVSSANLSDIKDDNISEGTVSYNPETNTLTMTNVTADMASDDNCFIESTIADLKVNLLGTNEVTLNYGMYQTDNCFARLKTGTGSLTFETQRAQNLDDEYVFGSLTVNLSSGLSTIIDGSSDKTLVAQGYTISNTFGGDTPCWRISDNLTDQVKVWYDGALYDLAVAGVLVTSANASNVLGAVNQYNQQPTVVFAALTNTLTLNGASVGQITYSGTSNLTIAFGGTCSITTEETSAIQYVGSESDRPKLTFSLTNETGSLSINGESFVIKGFSDVDFGNLNLASTYAQGVYYDTDDFLMRSHDTPPRDLTITTETYYPIWIFDPSLSNNALSYTQLSGESTSVTVGGGTVSFIGDHTITISNVNFHYEGNTLIVVGPSMTELTVNLVGESTATDCSVLSLWDTTPLTFTTSESDPGSLTGNDIVSWMDFGNGQISYQNGLNIFYDVENSYKKTISTTGTYFKIGNTKVSATGDITTSEGTAHFDASSNTLTLTGATIGEQGAAESTDIQVLVDNLIIEISGTNRIYGNITYNGSNYQSSNIQINKASNAESASLKVTNVEGFTSCTWGDGLYLSAQDAQGATIDVHYEHYEGEGGSMQSYYGEGIADVIFSTTPSNTIWVVGNTPNAEGVIQGTGIEGTVTYSNGVLTLNGATISTGETHPSPLIVCNGDLTVNLVGEDNQVYFNGDYGTYIFKNNGTTGTLTFTGTGSLSINTDYDEGTYIGLCDGFSTVDFGNLTYTVNGDTKFISPLNISTPMMNVFEGKIAFITEGYLFGSTTYYKIVYADDPENEEEVPLTNSDWSNYNEKITISELTGPCTVYAYTKYNDKTGNSAKAKLFGPAEEIQRIVYGETASLAIAPAIEDGDGIMIYGIESNYINFNETTQKATATTMGSESFPVPLKYTGDEYEEGKTFILNYSNFEMQVEVVPPAPTISLEDGTYLSTHDPITITRTGLDNTTNTTIKYKWDDGTAQTYSEAIPVQNGTLTAWVEYSDGTTTVSSDETSVEYTVNTDIATLYVAPIADIPYTGSAVTPTIVVKATEDAEASLVAGTDYTVSYKQGETAVAATDLINVATYTAVITGQGSYGGTKEVTFNVIQATPTITFAQESYSAILGETFTSPATVDNWPVTPTASSDMSVANISEGQIVLVGVGTTTITVTYAGDDNYNSTSASYELVVSRALDVAFVGDNLWASYYSTENLALPEGLTAYVVSQVNETSGVVTVQAIGYIPANNAVLLEREQNGAASGYTAGAYTGTTTTVNNLLSGSPNTTDISSLGSGPVYVLFNDKFKRAISGTIPARRAYLALNAAVAPVSAPQYLTINIVDGNSTGVNDVRSKMAEVGDDYYDLSGRKLQKKPAKSGVYIQNGKKVYFNNNK